MKTLKRIFPALLVISLVSCQPDTPGFLAKDSLASSDRPVVDSSMTPKEFQLDAHMIDSLLRVEVDLQKPIDESYYSPVAVTQFSSLASKTNGATYFLTDSRKITQEILRVIDDRLNDKTDVVFMIDNTGSMADDIDNVRNGLGSIIEALKKKSDVRLAVASYGDRIEDPSIWYSYMPFTTDFSKAKEFIDGIKLTGGGDDPESVYDGAAKMMDDLEWRKDAKKMILLLGDAPGLMPPFADYSLDDIVKRSKEHGILMNYYPVIISPLTGGAVPTMKEAAMVSTVYPVPATGPVNVLMNASGDYDYNVYDTNGKEVLNGNSETSDNFQLDVSDISNGVYILRIQDKATKKFEDQKIIVNK